MITALSSPRFIVVAVLFFVGALAPSEVAGAQRVKPLGFSSRSEFSSARTFTRDTVPPARPARWESRGFLNWTGLGVMVGGVAGGIWAGMQIAHSDDPMLANLGLAIGIGGGAVIGGLVGALAYTVSHSPHAAK